MHRRYLPGLLLALLLGCFPLLTLAQCIPVETLWTQMQDVQFAGGRAPKPGTATVVQHPLLHQLDSCIAVNEAAGAQQQLDDLRHVRAYYLWQAGYFLDLIDYGSRLTKRVDFEQSSHQIAIWDLLCRAYRRLGHYDNYIQTVPELHAAQRRMGVEAAQNNTELLNIAIAYYHLRNYGLARAYWLESNTTDIDDFAKASNYNNIGLAYHKEGVLDSGRWAFDTAIELVELELQNSESRFQKDPAYAHHFMDMIRTNIVELDLEHADYDAYIGLIEQEIASSGDPSHPVEHLPRQIKLARAYYLKHEYSRALAYIDGALPQLKTQLFTDDVVAAIELKAKIYLATGQQAQAERLLVRAKALTDSLEQIKINGEFELASILYETDKKESELQRQNVLLAENEIQLVKNQQKQLLFALLLGGAALALVFLVLFLRKSRAQRRQIARSLDEKEVLLKEIHHRVKNNMQTISSLLKLQTMKSGSPEVKQLAREGQSRIDSMALVHQMLYSHSNLAEVNFREYAQQLARQITSSFRGPRDLELNVEVAEVYLDADTMITIGLILTELITNSLKHGFDGAEEVRDSPQAPILRIALPAPVNDRYVLSVSDNGKGLPEGFDPAQATTLGLRLVQMLAQELRATVTFTHQQGFLCTVEWSAKSKNG